MKVNSIYIFTLLKALLNKMVRLAFVTSNTVRRHEKYANVFADLQQYSRFDVLTANVIINKARYGFTTSLNK